MKYFVEGTMSIPDYWDVDLDADDEAEARSEAKVWVERTYPEAIDIEIIEVKQLV